MTTNRRHFSQTTALRLATSISLATTRAHVQ